MAQELQGVGRGERGAADPHHRHGLACRLPCLPGRALVATGRALVAILMQKAYVNSVVTLVQKL
jgi:hypothetical protein